MCVLTLSLCAVDAINPVALKPHVCVCGCDSDRRFVDNSTSRPERHQTDRQVDVADL